LLCYTSKLATASFLGSNVSKTSLLKKKTELSLETDIPGKLEHYCITHSDKHVLINLNRQWPSSNLPMFAA